MHGEYSIKDLPWSYAPMLYIIGLKSMQRTLLIILNLLYLVILIYGTVLNSVLTNFPVDECMCQPFFWYNFHCLHNSSSCAWYGLHYFEIFSCTSLPTDNNEVVHLSHWLEEEKWEAWVLTYHNILLAMSTCEIEEELSSYGRTHKVN